MHNTDLHIHALAQGQGRPVFILPSENLPLHRVKRGTMKEENRWEENIVFQEKVNSS